MPVCLTIAGLDPSGGAGVVADVKTFTRFGCFAAAAVTSVTFQNTAGVFGSVHQTADSVRRQVEAVLDDYDVAAVKSGMLPTREIIEAVADIIESRQLKNVVVDPVVRSTSGYDLIDQAALDALIEKLFPLAAVITPNIPEAKRIAGIEIASTGDIAKAAASMQAMGAKSVLIKGGHGSNAERRMQNAELNQAVDRLFCGDDVVEFAGDYIDTTATHGTGCVLSSAIAANLAIGKTLNEAIGIAKAFVTEAIRNAPMLGRGNSPINI
jgi:hydroxymethylpyrimidine/phosphomethylpyrimidine kinase